MPGRDGETLIVQGDPCDQTLEITCGVGRAVRYSREGDRQIMAFFFPGDLVGLPLSSRHRYSFEAVSRLRFVRHSSGIFRPGFPSLDLVPERLAQAIWREEKAFISRGLILGRVGVQARLAAFLIYLSQRLPAEHGLLEFAIPQGDIASYLGTSPETVCRTLRRLRDNRIIAMPRRDQLQILDQHSLDLIAEGE
ncbi:Crp/Fnr family transcriptional regulator [Altererythrobacter lutimaris]|uniref:Crp/Fnr family transcriptional regulator n=1 Tax=Altererythrobacter lutimaris TaxID=2743979 RepID=A0A850HDT7_9SPHN|nr:Crp/Fnr family transcriptional regulator [Altererythrobacter lutimaris]NVE95999.1 Crp/Fnr family transcriptional regulator [Altererythrobacter lutimaris]